MDHALNNGQSDASALELVRPVQALENAEELVGVAHIESGAVVADEIDGFRSPLAADFDFGLIPARAGVFEGVGDEIGPSLPQQGGIAPAGREIADPDGYDPLRLLGLHIDEDALYQLVDFHRLLRQGGPAQAGEGEQIVDQRPHPLCAVADGLEITATFGRKQIPVILQDRMGETVHRPERCPEIVRNRIGKRLQFLVRQLELLRPFRHTMFQGEIQLLDLLLGRALLAEIGIRAEPVGDFSRAVPEGKHPGQEPAVVAIRRAQRKFHFKRNSGRKGFLPPLHHLRQQGRVVQLLPAVALHLAGRGAGVIVPALVVPENRPIRTGRPGELGNRIDHGAELLLQFAYFPEGDLQFFLCNQSLAHARIEEEQAGGKNGEAEKDADRQEEKGRGRGGPDVIAAVNQLGVLGILHNAEKFVHFRGQRLAGGSLQDPLGGGKALFLPSQNNLVLKLAVPGDQSFEFSETIRQFRIGFRALPEFGEGAVEFLHRGGTRGQQALLSRQHVTLLAVLQFGEMQSHLGDIPKRFLNATDRERGPFEIVCVIPGGARCRQHDGNRDQKTDGDRAFQVPAHFPFLPREDEQSAAKDRKRQRGMNRHAEVIPNPEMEQSVGNLPEHGHTADPE